MTVSIIVCRCASYWAFFTGSVRHALADANSLRIRCESSVCWPNA